MIKKCLNCRNASDNQTHICSACMAAVNEVRRPIKLRWYFKKGFILYANKAVIFFAIIIPLAIGIATMPGLFYKVHLPRNTGIIILCHAAIVFSTSFIIIRVLASLAMPYLYRIWYKQLLDNGNYYKGPTDRIRVKAPWQSFFKVILVFYVIFFASYLLLLVLTPILDLGWGFKSYLPLSILRNDIMKIFSSGGSLLGWALSFYIYSDWEKNLEK